MKKNTTVKKTTDNKTNNYEHEPITIHHVILYLIIFGGLFRLTSYVVTSVIARMK